MRFADSVRFVHSAGASRFLEVGPSSGLTASIEELLADAPVTTTSALRKDRPEPMALTDAVARGFVAGMDVDWRGALGTANFVELPTYAFERRRYWLSGDGAPADAAGLGLAAGEHALLGAVVELPTSGGVVLTGRLSPTTQGWLADHAVGGVVLFPGAGFVELAIRAGDEVGCGIVDELNLAAPLVFPDGGSVAVQVVVGGPDDSGARSVSVFSRADAGSGWPLHAEGVLSTGSIQPSADLSAWPPVGAVPVDLGDGYEQLAERGYGVRTGVPRPDIDVASWRRSVRRSDAARRCRSFGGRVRGSPGDARRGIARGDPGVRQRRARRGLDVGAVLLAAGLVARRGRGGGACTHRAGRPVFGVDRVGRRAGPAGALGGLDGGPAGDRSAATGRGVELRTGPALRGRLVRSAVRRGAAGIGNCLGRNGVGRRRG